LTSIGTEGNGSSTELYYAALFNTLHGWRFSFGRKASMRRLGSLDLTPLHDEFPKALDKETEKNNSLTSELFRTKEQEFAGQDNESS
jgi:hypothetical protein